MKGYIYKIVNKNNGKFYIGSTKNIEKRKHKHFEDLKHKKHHSIYLQRAYDKYGENSFIVEVKELKISSEKELRQLEERYIRFCWSSGKLYNVSKNSSGGDLISYHPYNKEFRMRQSKISRERYEKMSEEEKKFYSDRIKGEKNPNYGKKWSKELREKVSRKRKEYYLTHDNYIKGKTFEEVYGVEKANELKEKMSERYKLRVGEKNSFYGKHHSEETKKKLSEKNLGVKPPNSKKVSYNGEIYDSANDCAKVLKIPMGTVAYRCRNNIYGFSYVGENDDLPQKETYKKWTSLECEELASKCSTIKEFREKYSSAYSHLIKNKEEYERIKSKYFKYIRNYWTLEMVMEIAKRYDSYKELCKNEKTAYSSIIRHKWNETIKEFYENK